MSRTSRILTACMLIGAFTPPCWSVDYGAAANGNWNVAGTWTPAGGPPGAADNASIGSTVPAGSLATVSVTLTSDQTVQNLLMGRAPGGTGTLNLAGRTLTVPGGIEIGNGGGIGTLNLGGGHFVTGNLTLRSANSLTLSAADRASTLRVYSGSTVTTGHVDNLSTGLEVFDTGSQLNLNAALSVVNDIDLRGNGAAMATLNANGNNITARDIFIGRGNNAGQILNDGAITANRNLSVDHSTFAFDANDDADGLYGFNNALLTLVPQTQLSYLELNTGASATVVAAANVSGGVGVFGNTSQLTLNAPLNLTADIDLRGTNDLPTSLNANGNNITARDIYLGRFNHAAQILNDGAITASRNLLVDRSTFAFDANDDAEGLYGSNNAVITLVPQTQVSYLELNSGATTTVVATGNVSGGASVFGNTSQLTLNAALNLTADLDLRGTGDLMATVNANGNNITARDIYVGRFNNAAQILNGGAITATRNLFVDRSTFAFDANDDAEGLYGYDGAAITLVPQTQVSYLELNSGATTTLVATANVSGGASVFGSGSQLTLNAALNVTGDLDLRGTGDLMATVNANGNNITARDIYVGRFNSAAQIVNDGAITATRNLVVDRSSFAFDSNDDADGLYGYDNAVITLVPQTQLSYIELNSGATATLQATGNVSQGVTLNGGGSQLILNAALNVSQDVDLRGTGDTPATLNGNGNNITARDIYVGRFNSAAQILNDGAITATRNLIVDRSTFAFDSNDDADGLYGYDNAMISLVATTQLTYIELNTGATTTIQATGNVSQGVGVIGGGSQMNLNAPLNVAFDVDLRGSGDTPATLNANGNNITARDIFVGRFNNAAQILNDGAITATRNLIVDRSTFAFDANDDAEGVYGFDNAVITLVPETRLGYLELNSGATSTLVATANVNGGVSVIHETSRLDLAANLNVANDVFIRGQAANPATLHAHGFDLTARDLAIGQFNAAGVIQQLDLLTVSRTLSVERSNQILDGGFDLVGSALRVISGSVLNVTQSADSLRGLSLEGPTLDILDTSVLDLDFDATLGSFGDWIFRWRNPNGGNRVATINALVASGRITVSASHPFDVIDNGDGFTYIAKFTTDYNNDHALNCADLNLLTAAIVAGNNNPSFDLTGDGLVNIADRDRWLQRAGQIFVRSGGPFLPGDANLDGVVDGSDFGIWNSNKFTTNSAWCSGDFNTDGVVDGSDFGIWNANKFRASDQVNLVPEPAMGTGIGLCIGLAWAMFGRSSKS